MATKKQPIPKSNESQKRSKPPAREEAQNKLASLLAAAPQAGSLAAMPGDLINSSGDATIQAQAARLSDMRFQTEQRQVMAAHLGRVGGNQYLQRVMAQINQDERKMRSSLSGDQVDIQHNVDSLHIQRAFSLLAPIEVEADNQGYAEWILDARKKKFVVLGGRAKKDLEAIKEGKILTGTRKRGRKAKEGKKDKKEDTTQISLDTKTEELPILKVIYEIVDKRIERWIDEGRPKEKKPFLIVGSFLTHKGKRPGELRGSLHGKGGAIDLPGLRLAETVEDVIAILEDLPKGSYGLGLPAQGDFFKPEHDIEFRKAKLKPKMAKLESTKGILDLFELPLKKPDDESEADKEIEEILSALEEPDKERQEEATIVVGWEMHKGAIYASTWVEPEVETDKSDKKKRKHKKKRIGKWGVNRPVVRKGAYRLLQSDKLKKKFDEMRAAGYKLMIFPDFPKHMHIQVQGTAPKRKRQGVP